MSGNTENGMLIMHSVYAHRQVNKYMLASFANGFFIAVVSQLRCQVKRITQSINSSHRLMLDTLKR